jgi:chromosome segregation ATPase
LKGMIFYLGFRETHKQVVAKNETLRKKLDESQMKIRWLESKVEASQMMYECFRKEHGTTYGKFIFAREEANRLNARLLDVTTELGACRSKVDALSQSLLAVKTKFCKAKEKLREYKTIARSFYRQLSFASWGRDTGFYMGYL